MAKIRLDGPKLFAVKKEKVRKRSGREVKELYDRRRQMQMTATVAMNVMTNNAIFIRHMLSRSAPFSPLRFLLCAMSTAQGTHTT